MIPGYNNQNAVAQANTYNGNIKGAKFSYTFSTTSNSTIPMFSKETIYGYKYDRVNRLVAADAVVGDFVDAQFGNTSNPYPGASYGIGDEFWRYDMIGNIRVQDRIKPDSVITSGFLPEEFSYTYFNGTNRLEKVEDGISSGVRNYSYDANGNLTGDDYRRIDTTLYMRGTYPHHVVQDDDHSYYLYDHADQRICKKYVSLADTTHELYIKDALGRDLSIVTFLTTVGTVKSTEYFAYGTDRVARITPQDTLEEKISPDKVTYFLYDHLGNTRVAFRTDSMAVPLIVNAQDYYSYGKILREYHNGDGDRYLTTQHERDQQTGLDYRGARYYDSDVARFLSIDPLRSKRASLNPYNYVSGNPIIRVDPNGMLDDNYTVDADGNVTLDKKTDDNFDRITGTNSDGKSVSIEIEKGFITPFKTESFVADRTRPEDDEQLLVNYNVSFYGGSLATATKVFEFMANVTRVEWGLYKFGETSAYPTGILTTSHDQSTDVSGKLIKDAFFFASDFFGHDHIHPGGGTTPSGYLDDRPSGDIGFALGLIPEFKRDLTFRIFTRGVGYTPYDTRTIFDDEIIVKPK